MKRFATLLLGFGLATAAGRAEDWPQFRGHGRSGDLSEIHVALSYRQGLPTGGSYYASPVAGDGRIYVASLQGKVTAVKTGGSKPEVLHTADFGKRILATPALVGKNLNLRTHSKLYAFGK